MNTMNAQDWIGMINAASAAIQADQAVLNEYDSAVGDGDHGTAIAAAYADAVAQVSSLIEPTPSAVFKACALSFMNRMGGASGAIYGSFFLRMSTALGEKVTLTQADISAALRAGLEGVMNRGKASPGDKTLVDALYPAVSAFEAATDLSAAFRAAAAAAETGAQSTVNMAAKHGRAKFASERSIGHLDAGAASLSKMFAAFSNYWSAVEKSHHGET